MNWLDIAVLIFWAVLAFWGFRTGIIKMIVPLVVVVVGLALSSRIAGPVGNILSFISDNENVQSIAAFIVIFIGLLILGTVLSRVTKILVNIIPLGGLANNASGAVIGLVVGFILLSGILTGLQKFPIGAMHETIDDSTLGTFLADNFDVVTRGLKIIPSDWNQKANDVADGMQDNLRDSLK
jgi:membrane protein required for colicin V production|tara:strand:- start:12 stop:557 length:546 start_codon:yes stop_codon:yes gene_type:complete